MDAYLVAMVTTGKITDFWMSKYCQFYIWNQLKTSPAFHNCFCFGCTYHRTQIIARQSDPLFQFMKTHGIPVFPTPKTCIRSRILKILFLLPPIYTKWCFFTPIDVVVGENWCLGIPICNSPFPMGLGRGYRGFQFGKTVRRLSGFKLKPQKSNGLSQILLSNLAWSIWYHWIQLFMNFSTEIKSKISRSSVSRAKIMCFITYMIPYLGKGY